MSSSSRSLRAGLAALATLGVAILLLIPVPPGDPLLDAFSLPLLDKGIHALLFGTLAAAWTWGLDLGARHRGRWALLLALATYGVGLELLQALGATRSAELWDAVADALGAALVLFLPRALQPARRPVDSR